jgi:predicted O-methyltransferase YrrM
VLTETIRSVVPMSLYLRRRPLEPQLTNGRLGEYLQALRDRRDVPGAILEIGCFRGASTVEACRMLREIGDTRPYICIDTFAGFVEGQFEVDVTHGTPESFRDGFAANPRNVFERTMKHFGFPVQTVQADICTIADDELPEEISVCLVDVDLAVPIRDGLEKVVPRLAPGGIALVDDCDEATDWRGARVGYQEYVQAHGLPERYTVGGFGVVEAR